MRVLLALALIAALAYPASAHECGTWSTTTPDIDVAGAFYVDDDCTPHGCAVAILFSFWGYQESNGIPGLQRDDEVVDDTCHGMIPGDTIIF